MKAVVIGGSGFLGLNIAAALKAAGHEVVATRRRSSNTIFLRRLGIPMAVADLDDPESLTQAMRGCDVVYFAAAHYPRYSVDTEKQVETAVAGVNNLTQAARLAGGPRLIYTGTVSTVGRPVGRDLARETDGNPRPPAGSTYFAVKLAIERQLMGATDLEIIHLLPTGCLGPFDHKVGTGFFVVGLATGVLNVYTDGRINMVDARDVADAHVAAANRGRAGERYILGGHNLTVSALLREMAEILEVAMPSRQLSAAAAVALATEEEERCLEGAGRGRPLLSREIVDMIVEGQHVDTSKAAAELGLEPRPLAETILASHHWYRKNGYIRRD